MSIYEFLQRLEKDPFDPELEKLFLTAEEKGHLKRNEEVQQ